MIDEKVNLIAAERELVCVNWQLADAESLESFLQLHR